VAARGRCFLIIVRLDVHEPRGLRIRLSFSVSVFVSFVVFVGGGGRRGRGVGVRERVLIRGLSGIRVRDLIRGAKIAPGWDLLIAGPSGWTGGAAVAEKGGGGTRYR
jgi:hypothetical protein